VFSDNRRGPLVSVGTCMVGKGSTAAHHHQVLTVFVSVDATNRAKVTPALAAASEISIPAVGVDGFIAVAPAYPYRWR
jgi:hypothetical protein